MMESLALRWCLVLSGVLLANITGCSSPAQQTTCIGTYQNGVSQNVVALDYPEPAATNVSTAAGLLILSSSHAVPIEVSTVSGEGAQSPIVALPTALPSSLPSPHAPPLPGPQNIYFAVALPMLAPETTYRVMATVAVANVGCVGAVTHNVLEDAGDFTTQ